MALDRNASRLRIVREGHGQAAVERVARTSLARLPITLVDRARAQLRRFFSEEAWTVEDDAALSGVVGPGEGWTDDELAPGMRLGFGWKGNTFKIEVEADEVPGAPAAPAAPETAPAPAFPVHERTLGDTFEDAVVIELGRTPTELRFATGPGTTSGSGTFTRDEQGSSAAVAALFREFAFITGVRIEPSTVFVTVDDETRWRDTLLEMFDTILEIFVPPRGAPNDRQYERALNEVGSLSFTNSRDLARLLDASTSPDAAFRQVAMAKLENADPLVVQKPWTRSLEDSSRAVRRAAIRAMAHVSREDLRLLFERALGDKDACVRYYGLRGLGPLGVGRAEQSVERLRRDDDIRVRIAAQAALDGQTPQ